MSAEELVRLARLYETEACLERDPAQFMHRYGEPREQEVVAVLAANLAFGRRSQILARVSDVLRAMGSSPAEWIARGDYEPFFSRGAESFYRMFSHDTMRLFFDAQRKILGEFGSLGAYFRRMWEDERSRGGTRHLCRLIAAAFPASCSLVPRSDGSASKRLNMFLRWMVRDNSPVDVGLWTWFPKAELLMPLDTHVMQEATRLGLISPGAGGKVRGATMRLCRELTGRMGEIFPGDPVRGDYALFGLGADRKA